MYLPIMGGSWICKPAAVPVASQLSRSQQADSHQDSTQHRPVSGKAEKQSPAQMEGSHVVASASLDSSDLVSPMSHQDTSHTSRSTAKQASQSRRAVALFAAFAVSGLMHELIVW